jgi:leader peptidase (prepilin peptidase) / N-methyltransferase
MPVLVAASALLGLAVGSFLGVVVDRVPARQSLVRPGSRCAACEHPIRHRHNVPVLGWAVLRGRCPDCSTRFSIRYPILELATGGLFGCLAVRAAGSGELAALPAYLFFAALGVALALIDVDVRRLPDALVLPAYPVLAALLAGAALVQHDLAALLRAGVGAAALFGVFFVIRRSYPGGMGFGDVKLAGLIGAALGYLSYPAVFIGAFAAFAIAAMTGLAAIAVGRAGRRSAIPFGPFLVAGALLAVFATGPLVSGYTRLILGA